MQHVEAAIKMWISGSPSLAEGLGVRAWTALNKDMPTLYSSVAALGMLKRSALESVFSPVNAGVETLR